MPQSTRPPRRRARCALLASTGVDDVPAGLRPIMRLPAGGRRIALIAGLAIVFLASYEVWHLSGRSDIDNTRTGAPPGVTSAISPPSSEASPKPIPLYDTAWLAPAFS